MAEHVRAGPTEVTQRIKQDAQERRGVCVSYREPWRHPSDNERYDAYIGVTKCDLECARSDGINIYNGDWLDAYSGVIICNSSGIWYQYYDERNEHTKQYELRLEEVPFQDILFIKEIGAHAIHQR